MTARIDVTDLAAYSKKTNTKFYINFLYIVVKYRDDKGETIESPMALDPSERYEVGQKVRIKYIPGLHQQVRPVK